MNFKLSHFPAKQAKPAANMTSSSMHFASIQRSPILVGLILVALLGPAACKKKPSFNPVAIAPSEAEVEKSQDAAAQGLQWQPTTRLELRNGARLDWLTEADRMTTHLRMVVPTQTLKSEHPEAALSATAMMVEYRLNRRLSRYRPTIEWSQRADRLELHVQIGSEYEAQLFAALGGALAEKRPQKELEIGRGKFAALPPPASASAVAASHVQQLLEKTRGDVVVANVGIAELTAGQLAKSYEAFSDPRIAWLIIHSPNQPQQAEAAIEGLATRWKSRAFLSRQTPGLFERLRPSTKAVAPAKHSAVVEKIERVETAKDGASTLIWTSIARTSTLAERVMLQAIVRVLQEEDDVRLVVSGDIGLIQVPLRLGDDLDKAEERFHEFFRNYHQVCSDGVTAQRLKQTLDMWRGARWVQASFQGEDRTAFWSHAFDLSGDEAQMGDALEAEARLLAAMEVAALVETCKRIADPWHSPMHSRWSVLSGVPELAERIDNARKQIQSGPLPRPEDK